MSKQHTVHLNQIQVADNVRSEIDLDGLNDLAQSIATVGLLSPLTVSPNGTGDTFVLVAGHRRRAAIAIGISDGILDPDFPIDVVVREEASDPTDRLVVQLIENLQREDISLMDEARGFAQLREQGVAQQDIASRVGRSPSHVSKRLSLLKLPEDVQEMVESGLIPVEVAIELPKVAEDDARNLAKRGGALTVRDVKAAQAHTKRLKAKQKVRDDLAKLNITVFGTHLEARDACPEGKNVTRGEPVGKVADLPKRLAGVFVSDYAEDIEIVPVTFKAPSKEELSHQDQQEKERAKYDRERAKEQKAQLARIDNFVDNPPAAAELLGMFARTLTMPPPSTFTAAKEKELADEGRSFADWVLSGEFSTVEARKLVAAAVLDRLAGRTRGCWTLDADGLLALIDTGVTIGVSMGEHNEAIVLNRLADLWRADAEVADATAETESEEAAPTSDEDQPEETPEVTEG